MTVYTLYPPTVPSGTLNFSFTATIAAQAWVFNFQWRTDHWTAVVTLPDGTLRESGVIPEVINWSRNTDYNLTFSLSSADEIGLDDISDIAIHVIIL